MPQLPLRIAILLCDTPPPAVNPGGYAPIFKKLIESGADALGHPGLSSSAGLELSNFDVVTAQEYPELDEIDAVLISGSKYNSFDNDPWILKLVAFTEGLLKQDRIRIIGVCFGHQIIGRALGAKVGRSDKGWEISVVAMDLTKKGQELFGRPALALHQMHRDIIYGFPEGVEELAYTDKCANHGMYVPKRLLTVQGHPEFTGAAVRTILDVRLKGGVFDQETVDEALERVDKYHDGVVVSQAFLKFLLD